MVDMHAHAVEMIEEGWGVPVALAKNKWQPSDTRRSIHLKQDMSLLLTLSYIIQLNGGEISGTVEDSKPRCLPIRSKA